MSSELDSTYTSHPMYSVYLNYAQRSLLGGCKGQLILSQLKHDDPPLYIFIMSKAKQLVKSVPDTPQARTSEIARLMHDNTRHMAEIVNKQINSSYEKEMHFGD